MGDDTQNTQTQTQTEGEFSQNVSNSTPTSIPNIWGRLYLTKASSEGRHCWRSCSNPVYFDLIQPEFTLGRALNCTYPMRRETIKDNIIKNVSKLHFTIKRDLSEPLCPAVIKDSSHNGTFVNSQKVGKGNSRVLDDNDEISITHPVVKIFVFKDLLKNEQDQVPKEVSQKYYISRVLGQGACGVVKLVYNKTKCTKHAMKVIKKSRLPNGQVNHLTDPSKIMNEINIMIALKHPCIISTEEVFDAANAVYIVLELMEGGELFDRITKHGHLTESQTRLLFRQMVLAVKYLHSQGITHRDLKPENVLLESGEEETLVKISDFGLSKFVGEDSFMKTVCGTPLYLAPEVIKSNGVKCYGPQVDVWSLGVIFFVCLAGYLPFSPDYKDLSLTEQILQGRYRFSLEHWKHVSLPAKQLMMKMLTVPVHKRITLDQILNHSWMQHTDTIIKVEKLLSRNIQTASTQQILSLTCTEDEKASNSDTITQIRLVATAKRALSELSFNSSCEPIAKRLRVACDKEDTSSTNSFCSED